MQSLITHFRTINKSEYPKAHFDAADFQRKEFLRNLQHNNTQTNNKNKSSLLNEFKGYIRHLLNTPEIPDYYNLSPINPSIKYNLFH